jgi:cyclopropane-fatty-acyl-phospholipid synthase
VTARYDVDGRHYARTSRDWLANLDFHRDEVRRILAAGGGDVSPERLLQRWRVFFLACLELFAYRQGQEWWVSHYLFEPRR